MLGGGTIEIGEDPIAAEDMTEAGEATEDRTEVMIEAMIEGTMTTGVIIIRIGDTTMVEEGATTLAEATTTDESLAEDTEMVIRRVLPRHCPQVTTCTRKSDDENEKPHSLLVDPRIKDQIIIEAIADIRVLAILPTATKTRIERKRGFPTHHHSPIRHLPKRRGPRRKLQHSKRNDGN